MALVDVLADPVSPLHIVLEDLPEPSGNASTSARTTAWRGRFTPEQYIVAQFDAEEWEQFTLEWAHGFPNPYERVKRMGGTGDEGLDVVGLLSDAGLEGEWDCFQCKYYQDPLQSAETYDELLKIFTGVVKRSYTMPRRYRLVAPRGCVPSMEKLFEQPSKLQEAFIAHVVSRTKTKKLKPEVSEAVLALARQTDFSRFKSEPLAAIVSQHATTRWHAGRFPVPLPPRPAEGEPSPIVEEHELVYVGRLIEVYQEKYDERIDSIDRIAGDPRSSEHFERQRIDFHSASALKSFARDAVPSRVIRRFERDIHAAVIDTEQKDHPDGMERLGAVLKAAQDVQLTRTELFNEITVNDRKGMCHHLANEQKLRWCR